MKVTNSKPIAQGVRIYRWMSNKLPPFLGPFLNIVLPWHYNHQGFPGKIRFEIEQQSRYHDIVKGFRDGLDGGDIKIFVETIFVYV